MSRGGKTPYHAHWYCRFKRVSANEFSDIRLLKRLTGATFKILRFSLVAPIEGGRAPARADEFVYM